MTTSPRYPASSGTYDPSQRFFLQAPICRTLGVSALGQVVQLAPHSGQIARVWKSDQIEVRLLIFNGSQERTRWLIQPTGHTRQQALMNVQ